MNADDDQDWLDALAGREQTPSATVREALVLRAALREREHPAAQFEPGRQDSRRENALIAQAVREGIMAPPPRATTRRWRTGWQLPLAASVLLLFGAGIFINQYWSTPPVVRGDEAGIVRLQAADPAALKREILAQLRAAGVDAAGYETLGVYGIDADLAQPLTPAVRDVLATYRIAEPPDGVLRIEIRSSQ